MPGMKTLINRTGKTLKVTLYVREGDHPTESAGTVDVVMAAGSEPGADEGPCEQKVTYGDEHNIYLNGIETMLIDKGSAVGERSIVVDRGSGLDRALNTNDTIEFLFDGHSVLVSATNSEELPFSFEATTE